MLTMVVRGSIYMVVSENLSCLISLICEIL